MFPILLRAPEKDDTNFIYSSWLKSYRNSEFAKSQCNSVYFDNHKKVVTDILTRSLVLVACNPEDENHVYGYMVYEELPASNVLIHYVYVKHTYRRTGVAKQMLKPVVAPGQVVLISHTAPIIKSSKTVVCLYDPYRMFDISE